MIDFIVFDRILRKLLSSKIFKSGMRKISGKATLNDNIKELGYRYKSLIDSYPKLKSFLKNWVLVPTAEGELFNKIVEDRLPQMSSLRTLSSKLGEKNLDKLIGDMINSPDKIISKLKKLSSQDVDDIQNSMYADINESPLSSSWLGYGTFIPNKNDNKKGYLILTTKTGSKFKTQGTVKHVWDLMRTQIGVTHYDKSGHRKGSEYGAGTILHKFIPKKGWRKI